MAVYYRVDLKDKENHIIYPNIDNEIRINQNEFRSMKNIVIGNLTDNKEVKFSIERYSSIYNQSESANITLGNDSNLYFEKILNNIRDTWVWFNSNGIYFRTASAPGIQLGSTNYLVSAVNRDETLTGQKIFDKTIKTNVVTTNWTNTYNGTNVGLYFNNGAANHTAIAVANSTNGKFAFTVTNDQLRAAYITAESAEQSKSVWTAVLLDENGNTRLPGQLYLDKDNKGSWTMGKNLTSTSIITPQFVTGYYQSILGTKTKNGIIVNIGGINEEFGFYGFYPDIVENIFNWAFYVNAETGQWHSTNAINAPEFNGRAVKLGSTNNLVLYVHNENEVNFGGTATNGEILFGYRGVDSRTSISGYKFMNANASLTDIYCSTMHGYATSANQASFLYSYDTRSTNPLPPAVQTVCLRADFKQSSYIGSPPNSNSYGGLLTFKPYPDTSGGAAYQMHFGMNGDWWPNLCVRQTSGNWQTWRGWYSVPIAPSNEIRAFGLRPVSSPAYDSYPSGVVIFCY